MALKRSGSSIEASSPGERGFALVVLLQAASADLAALVALAAEVDVTHIACAVASGDGRAGLYVVPSGKQAAMAPFPAIWHPNKTP